MILALVVFTCSVSYAVFRYSLNHYSDDLYEQHTIQDVGRLLPTKIERIEKGKEVEQIVHILKEARKDGLKVSIAGKRHSQGGHTYYPDGVVLDMTSFNKILDIDKNRKNIHVESGATWDEIQKALALQGLAVKVMQSQNIFTVGGSISVNVHGRDIKNESLGQTINWFHLLLPNGKIVKVDRISEPELFKDVLGGYGLFGVILDVELQVTDDEVYEIRTKKVSVEEFPAYVHALRENPGVKMAYARVSVAPRTSMNSMFVVEYHTTEYPLTEKLRELKEDEQPYLTYTLLNLSRKTGFGKDWLWDLQEKYFLSLDHRLISRNNAMRSESDFLLYKNQKNTDTLQEFFVPIDEYPAYVEDMKVFLKKDDINLLNFTIRYVSKDELSRLSYAKTDMIALVALFNHGKQKQEVEKAQTSIRKMIDITLRHNGTFYLPYYPYATKQQLLEAYPNFPEFVKEKEKVDPNGDFTSLFYERYSRHED
ncbi:decaprenylphospho-beta-D-ribofuranose 2-oxidase [Bacillus sp. SORGH_AS 510]|uniref:FAD-dependent oxidoreductase n=1 Tax=Bacillus sp. SORGH_AS_0510 TaxID=3041771 RepID=UPI00278114B8|nr:FAD-binding oxidoreductase [Bacillus sp. SORGH_AS_0510]MDQ1143657.1 decaprenylphospho-beta-D-ribofuranose 2-oxidase [Bacillus sp. SORGH_AS_0510]